MAQLSWPALLPVSAQISGPHHSARSDLVMPHVSAAPSAGPVAEQTVDI